MRKTAVRDLAYLTGRLPALFAGLADEALPHLLDVPGLRVEGLPPPAG